jgi:hypothetical protein
MPRRARSLGLAAALLLALLPGRSLACGLPLAARISFEQALLISRGDTQQLITSVQLSADRPNAGVIFPVPAAPSVDQPAGADDLFRYLAAATAPLVKRAERVVWSKPAADAAGAEPPGAGVDLLGRQTLGSYDVARLRADDPQALQGWLDRNGYSLPPAAAPILAAYVAEGWAFVAVRLADGPADGSLAPLRISYAGKAPVYPMRLGALSDRPVGVELFVLSGHRSQVPALETTFAGPLASLSPPPPAALAEILQGDGYLTRMRSTALDPASLTADFAVGQAPNDEPFRAVVTVYTDVYALRRYGLLVALICMVMVTPLSLVVAVGLRKRIDAIGPRASEKV